MKYYFMVRCDTCLLIRTTCRHTHTVACPQKTTSKILDKMRRVLCRIYTLGNWSSPWSRHQNLCLTSRQWAFAQPPAYFKTGRTMAAFSYVRLPRVWMLHRWWLIMWGGEYPGLARDFSGQLNVRGCQDPLAMAQREGSRRLVQHAVCIQQLYGCGGQIAVIWAHFSSFGCINMHVYVLNHIIWGVKAMLTFMCDCTFVIHSQI